MILFLLSQASYAQGIEAMIYASNQTENFDQENFVREYVIGETAYCAVLVSGFSVNDANMVDISANLRFLAPDGTVLFDEKNYARVKRTLAAEEKGLVLDNSFDVEFTPDDPPGVCGG